MKKTVFLILITIGTIASLEASIFSGVVCKSCGSTNDCIVGVSYTGGMGWTNCEIWGNNNCTVSGSYLECGSEIPQQ